jgi:hypothetical protein
MVQTVLQAGFVFEPGQEPTEARVQIFGNLFLGFLSGKGQRALSPSDFVPQTGNALIGVCVAETPAEALLDEEVVDVFGAPDIFLDLLNRPL